MKKSLFFIFLSFIFTIATLPAETVKKLEIKANPIKVALIVAEKGDSTKIADTFRYYGYSLETTEGDYKVMQDPNGNEIRYFFTAPEASAQYPKVKVKSKDTSKEIETRLENLNFKKIGNHYRRIVNYDRKHYTNCHFDTPHTLEFQRTPR